jgi:hypothetical protein
MQNVAVTMIFMQSPFSFHDIPSISPDMNYACEDCPTTGTRFQLSGRRGADEKFAALIIVCDLAATRRRIWVPIYTESPQGHVQSPQSFNI